MTRDQVPTPRSSKMSDSLRVGLRLLCCNLLIKLLTKLLAKSLTKLLTKLLTKCCNLLMKLLEACSLLLTKLLNLLLDRCEPLLDRRQPLVDGIKLPCGKGNKARAGSDDEGVVSGSCSWNVIMWNGGAGEVSCGGGVRKC